MDDDSKSRDSFIFYRSFYEAIKGLKSDVQGEIYTAIMEYSLNGKETENLKPMARSMFILIKPLIDANTKKFENGCKGGRPKKQDKAEDKADSKQVKRKEKPKRNLKETKAQPNVYVNEDVDVNENDNIKTPSIPQGGTEETFLNFIKLYPAPTDGVKRNYEGLVGKMETYQIPIDKAKTIAKMSNYGEVAQSGPISPVWLAISEINKGKIHSPAEFIISKLREDSLAKKFSPDQKK